MGVPKAPFLRAPGSHFLRKRTVVRIRNYSIGAVPFLWAFSGLGPALAADGVPAVAFQFSARLGLLLLLIALVLELARRFFDRDAISRQFEAKPVKRGELAEARDLSAKFLPQVPDLTHLQQIFEAGRRCVWFVEATSRSRGLKKSKRVGFFSIIRLAEQAIGLLDNNRLDAFRMDRTHIAGPNRKSKALYIGGLGASTFRARGWLVQHIRARIDQFFEGGGKYVFSRPVTDDGLRIATSLGFVPVVQSQPGLGNIYRLTSPDNG